MVWTTQILRKLQYGHVEEKRVFHRRSLARNLEPSHCQVLEWRGVPLSVAKRNWKKNEKYLSTWSTPGDKLLLEEVKQFLLRLGPPGPFLGPPRPGLVSPGPVLGIIRPGLGPTGPGLGITVRHQMNIKTFPQCSRPVLLYTQCYCASFSDKQSISISQTSAAFP